MQLHELSPIHKTKKPKRVGRGGKKGTYSGRGVKGQRARAGRKFQPAIRELIKRYPKLRGYRQKLKIKSRALEILKLEMLENKFELGDIVNPKTLLNKGLIGKTKGRLPEVKILGKSDLTKKLIIEGCQVSKSARERIEKAGGQIILKIKNQK